MLLLTVTASASNLLLIVKIKTMSSAQHKILYKRPIVIGLLFMHVGDVEQFTMCIW